MTTPVPLPGNWTFWADTTVGGSPLGPVSPTAFTCGWKLSDFGQGSVTMPVGGIFDSTRLLALWSWRLWAFYAGTLIWCGCPTGVQDTGLATVTLTLTELPGYLTKRQYDVTAGRVYTGVEQTTIAADLAGPVTDIGVALVTQAGSGVVRDRTYAYLDGSSRGDLLTQLAQVINGPEFRAEYSMSAGLPACTLRIAYPRVGSAAPGIGMTIPGDGTAYQATWDSDQLRTRTFAVGDLPAGAATTATKPVRVVDAPQAGLPRLDAVDDWPQVIVLNTLADKANSYSSMYASPALSLTATDTQADPPLGTYQVGDDVTVNITSPLLAGGLTATGRLTELAADAAAGTATWTVAISQPPPKARPALSAMLRQLQAAQRAQFHKALAPA